MQTIVSYAAIVVLAESMAAPAWQPQGGQPLGGPQGHWGAPNASASHPQGSPHGPPFTPPTTFSATQPGTGPSFGNASQLNSGLGNSPVRPVSCFFVASCLT